MPKNYAQTIPIKVMAGEATRAHNLRLVYDEWDQPANAFAQGVTSDPGQPIAVLAAGDQATINLTIAADNSAADSGSLVLRLVSDESGVQPWGYVTVEAWLTSAEPFLDASPHFVESGVLFGDQVTETITLENKGLAGARISKGNDHVVDAVRCAMLVREEGKLDPIGGEVVSFRPVFTDPVFV